MNTVSNNKTYISFAITKLVFTVTLTLTLLYSIFVLGYSWIVEDNIFNRFVTQQVTAIKRQYDNTKEAKVSKSEIYQLYEGWNDVPEEIWQTFQQEPNRVEYSLANGKTYHLARFFLDNEEYILLADVEGFEVSRDYFKGILVWLALFSILSCILVALLGWRIGRQISKPIEELAGSVEGLKNEDITPFRSLIKRMPNNEVGALANAIDLSFTQLNEALEREVHFTKDISHEIRTPISILQNAISQGVVSPQKHTKEPLSMCFSEQSVQQMKRAIENLAQTTHVLLALARKESSTSESVSLNQLIEQCVLNHFGLNHTAKGQSLELEIDMPNDDVMIETNRNLLEILLNNLLSNVVAHASGKYVKLSLEQKVFRLTNEFNHPLPSNFQSSGIKGQDSNGIGQGLSLIKRICDECNWTMEVELNKTKQQFSLLITFE